MAIETDSFADVNYEVRNGVAEVEIDRPARKNAMRTQTLSELDAARRLAVEDPDTSVVLIHSSSEDVFSAGADLAEVDDMLDADGNSVPPTKDWHNTLGRLANCELPTVCCVTGIALAGGLEVVLVCDLVVASSTSTYGDQHVNANLIAGGGATQRLPRIVGPRRAKELVLTGKQITAATAHEWGLVNEVVDEGDSPLEAARDLAGDIAGHDSGTLEQTKHLLHRAMETDLEPGLELERQVVNAHLRSDAAKEGIERFLNR
jgi:enoyl-CoA hydratase/carnithine racemase